MKDLIVTNDSGRDFLVRVVRKGDKYGLKDCKTHDEAEPLIEFYDQTYKDKPAFAPRGQFVSRYYAFTLAEDAHPSGLCLDGGNRDVWYVDADAMGAVHELAQQVTLGEKAWEKAQEKVRPNGVRY